ncbi:hypothetical protein TVAG_467750 [Trichomonas vaginalis G3]|uniref:Ankyrin repeat protein n=1 Tax=Trichomonas vaginalis (strain ATCC PRA-98 / G3) TaxID=412133 RepID=A2E0L5_TRIV3|nr:Ankyrin repeat family [Trichomonas vaginalis G3]EAY13760.1 hypothetical protein TVAG_467750 [Trichomonas vaginalis G3]KAI5542724.1 Ankyrin repeat family [Trichomonas vaginalis G3]|eukprot:XP_001325983.1 hypothetical protein [Trichomonas vaginalis G3]
MKLGKAMVLMEPYPVLQGDPTLILYAAYCNSINCFKWLFLNGASLNAKDKWGQDAAYFAISGGSLEILRILEQQGFEVYNLEPCIEHRQYHIFDWIIEQNLDEKGRYQHDLINNAYIFSARYNNAYTLCECLNYGADPMANLQLWGALHQSILYSDLQIAILLAQCSEIDVNWKDANGCSALLFATTNHCYKVVKALVCNPRVDINTFDNSQWTCLHRLVSDRATEMIKFICSLNGFDVNVRDINGISAFDLAKSMDYKDAMDIISKSPGFNHMK